jgi:hypothetical protein
MAATTKWYGLAAKHLANGDVDWDSDTFKVMLTTSGYTPNQDSHEFRSDVSNELAASGNYSAGGEALTGNAKSYDSATNQERLDADDVVFDDLTPSAAFRYAVIYKSRGGASSADELIAYVDFGANQDPGGSDFQIQWPSTGVVYMQAA